MKNDIYLKIIFTVLALCFSLLSVIWWNSQGIVSKNTRMIEVLQESKADKTETTISLNKIIADVVILRDTKANRMELEKLEASLCQRIDELRRSNENQVSLLRQELKSLADRIDQLLIIWKRTSAQSGSKYDANN